MQLKPMLYRHVDPGRLDFVPRKVIPPVFFGGPEENLAAKDIGTVQGIRIVDAYGTPGTVDLDAGHLGIPDIKAGRHRSQGSALKLEVADHVRVDFDVDPAGRKLVKPWRCSVLPVP